MQSQGVASCRNLQWILDLCAERHIDPRRLTRHVPHDLDRLRDPSVDIDWQSFLALLTSVGNYLTDDELYEAGTRSWQHKHLRMYAVTGKLLFRVGDQFHAVFGPGGVMARLYPFDLVMEHPAPGHLTVTLTMRDALPPCRTFQTILAGQLAGLPTSIGEPAAKVKVCHTESGAVFDVWYQSKMGPWTRMKRALALPLAARESARQLAVTYDSLLDQYQELRAESEKLKATEQRALESETRYQLLEDNIKDVIWIMDPQLRMQYISASIESLIGFSKEEFLTLDYGELFTEDSRAQLRDMVRRGRWRNLDASGPSIVEIEVKTRNGALKWLEVQVNFVLGSDGKPLRLLGMARDISERKAFEFRLQESEESYRAITTSAQDAIVTADHNNRITFANPATERIFGYSLEELEGMSLRQLMPNAHSGVLLYQQSREDQPGSMTIEGIKRSGLRVSLEASFAEHDLRGSHYITWIIRDITFRTRIEQERKALEQQLHAAQRMDSIGQLTGGIAHDFNNLLVAINGYAELGLASDAGEARLKQYMEEILHAGERAADMTNKLLAFSRRQIIEPKPLQVNQLIYGIEKIIDRLLPEHISTRFVPDLTDPTIVADPGQIEQVVVNLAVNARDAMPHGGQLTISIDQTSLAKGDLKRSYQRTGNFVIIRVEDTGSGMTEDIRKRLFEPFFTTKPEGAGTGLGMAVVFGIVKQHDGFIDVESIQGKGSKLEIYLPLAGVDDVHQNQAQSSSTPNGGHETILLVEDNLHVRDLARLILSDAGYVVIEANDGAEAIDVFKANANSIDLVVMDVVMPRLGGKQVMKQMKQIDPEARILFTSGYSSGGIHTNFILEEGLDFIPKPYGAEKLRERVRSILDKPGEA